MIIAIDTDNILEAIFTSLNTRASDLLTVHLKYNTPTAGGAINAERVCELDSYCGSLKPHTGNPWHVW